jgi:hypothetical protein
MTYNILSWKAPCPLRAAKRKYYRWKPTRGASVGRHGSDRVIICIMNSNKAPPKRRGRAQACSPNSPHAVAPQKPTKPAGATKNPHPNKPDDKTKIRRLAAINWYLSKEYCRVVYHDPWLVARVTLWIILRFHGEIIQIILLLIAMILQYRIHATATFGH